MASISREICLNHNITKRVDLLKSTWQPFHSCAFTRGTLVLFPFDSSEVISWYQQKATRENSGTGLLTPLLVFLKYIIYKVY